MWDSFLNFGVKRHNLASDYFYPFLERIYYVPFVQDVLLPHYEATVLPLVQPAVDGFAQVQEQVYSKVIYPVVDSELYLESIAYFNNVTAPVWNFYNLYGEELKSLFVLFVVSRYAFSVLFYVHSRGLFAVIGEFFESLMKAGVDLLKWIPGVDGMINSELKKVIKDIEIKLVPDEHRNLPSFKELPRTGLTDNAVLSNLKKMQQIETVSWKDGLVSGTVYHGGKALSDLLNEAYAMFSYSNPLHPDVFPSIRKMEAEIVSMCLNMYNAPAGSSGNVTSGGTESILMAVKAHRDWARDVKGITAPEMIVPVTVHAAFDKAAHYFGVTIIHAPLNPKTMGVDIYKVRSLMTRNTIMIAGSAPNYPHGIIDDIQGLGKLAKRYDVGFHVDCCLGSFVVPFLGDIGVKVPPFDFRVNGVTSISCDTHKFGFAPKGSSVVLYSDPVIRKYQYFVAPNWPGGIYASPSIAGSRAGALIAACWASLVKNGRDGYVDAAQKIVRTSNNIRDGIKKIDGLYVIGNPQAMVVAFASNISTVNIFAVGDKMTEKGWNLNTLQHPASIHICCTLLTVGKEEKFLDDLKASFNEVRKNPDGKKGMAAIYGLAASVPDKRLVVDIAKGYLDTLTKAF